MDLFDKNRKKQKSMDRTTYKLLDKALPPKEMFQRTRRMKVQKNQILNLKPKQWEKTKMCPV